MKVPNPLLRVSLAYTLSAIIVGLLVLFISVSKASLVIWAQESKENDIGGQIINFEVINKNGSREEGSYKLPEAKTLPNNPFYGFRRVRDWLWLMVFSQGDANKARTALLLADKKMAESVELMKDSSRGRMVIECGQEAWERLQYSDLLISRTPVLNDELKQIHKQIFSAGLAYAEMLKKGEEMVGDDREKYNQLMENLRNWNEKQTQDQEDME